jgi:hypothetical protein
MTGNMADAQKFLHRLAGKTLLTFQTFDDRKKNKKKDQKLAAVFHGDLDSYASKLMDLNQKGAGVFLMVNEGDGKGRSAKNVTRVRAVFADFDKDSPPENWGLTPHIHIESSPGKFHSYWLVDDCPLDKFTTMQLAIATKFKSDLTVNDVPRVMRIPGFVHHKGEPFLSRIVSMSDDKPYPLQKIIKSLGLEMSPKAKSVKDGGQQADGGFYKGSTEGGRTSGVVKLARSLSNYNYSEDEAVAFCLTHDERNNTPPLENTYPGKVEHTVRDVYDRYVYTEVPDYVTELNERNFVTRDGKTFVCTEEYDLQLERNVLHYSSFNDFKNFHGSKRVAVGTNKDGSPIYKSLGLAWLESKYRRQYEGIKMAPTKEFPGYYNLWKGFGVEQVKGSWKWMKDHILNIICDGDKQLFLYVMGWCARMVQSPGELGEVALVLQGGRGVGKGVFGNALRRLLAHHSCHITSTRHLTGNFNAHMESCVFLFVDEALWAGDKAGENVLKGLITEAVIPVERKFVDLKQVPNMLHILMASNNDWVVPAGLDERRYCILKVSDAKAGKYKYFQTLLHEMNNGGLEAMLFDLLKLDISNFNVRDFPKTVGLFEQKLQSMEPIEGWWYQKLQDGEISSCHGWETIPIKVAHEDYLEVTSKMSGQIRKASITSFGMVITKLLPKGWPKKKKHLITVLMCEKRVNHYEMPPLKECRKHFEGIIGENVTWDEAPLEDSVTPCEVDYDL